MISALTFLYNEEKNLEKCLSSIKDYVDEIIIFDLESTDRTFGISVSFTDKVYKVPYLLCGDSYKVELACLAKGDWLLWFYGDEVFPELTAKLWRKLTEMDRWTSYSFMRHEYMDEVRLNFLQNGQKVEYGSSACPNYQNRLHKKDGKIYYTELVHAEIHGSHKNCSMPSEYYFDHFKTSAGQEFDNIRLYVMYKFLIWKYQITEVPEFKKYVDSYKKIVVDSEAYNLSGQRKVHAAEEFWWIWRNFVSEDRMTLDEFEARFGVKYVDFLSLTHSMDAKSFVLKDKIMDRALKDMGVV